MRLSVRHTTHYRFSEPVAHGLHRLRLRPKSTHGQQVIDWSMDLDGAKAEVAYEDQHHNATMLVSTVPGTSEITVTCAGTVDTADRVGIVGPHVGPLPLWAFLAQTPLTRIGPRMRALVSALDADRTDRLALLHALSGAVLDSVIYETGHTDATTSAEEAMVAGHGVCQDHAHVFIGCARHLGIPARYVSGYLKITGLVEQEAGHGWAEAHVDGLGWVGFDISNRISPDDHYVRVATGNDYRDAAPMTGISWGSGHSVLSVSLAIDQQVAEQ